MSDPIQPLTPEQVAEHKESAAREGYVHRVFEEVDVALNVATGGLQDETISSRLARDAYQGHGVSREVGKEGSAFLDLFQKNHGATATAADLERAEQIVKAETESGLLPSEEKPS